MPETATDSAIDFQPEAIDFQPEIPSVRDVMRMSGVTAPVAGPQAPKVDMQTVGSFPRASFADVAGAARRGGTPQAFTEEPTRSGNPLTGAVEAVRGAGRIISSGAVSPPASRGPAAELPTEPERRAAMKGTSEVLGGTMQATAPFVLPESLVSAPVSTLTGLGVGTATGVAAKYGAGKAGLSPEAQELAATAGFFLPSATGALLRPRLGVAFTPEETVIRGGIAPIGMEPRVGEVRIQRGPKPTTPAGPGLEPPTIEGQTVEPTRDEIANAMEATNFAGPDQARAAHAAAKQAEAQVAPATPPPGRAGVEGAPAVTTLPAAAAPSNGSRGIAAPEIDFQPESDIEEARRRGPGEGPVETAKNAVPAGQRASDAIAKAATTAKPVKGEVLPPSAPVPKGRLEDIKDELRGQYPNNSEQQLEKAAREQLAFEDTQRRGAAKPQTVGTTAGATRDTAIMARLEQEHPDWSLSKRLQEAAKIANPASAQEVTSQPQNVSTGGVKQTQGEEKPYKYRSTQANIPEGSEAHTALESARARISDSDLMAKGKDVGGNHLTVKYGLKAADDDKLTELKQYLASLSPFEASLGKTEKFAPTEHSDGAAVINAPIEAKELHQINQELEQHGDFKPSDFGEYKPHATIAYVKPEAADRYVGMNVTAGKKFTVNEIAITDREGKQELVKLEGKGAQKVPTSTQVDQKVPAETIPHKGWMNRWDVDEAADRHANHPVLGKATKFLQEFRDQVDEHSDGWPYWNAPTHAAQQLMDLIQSPKLATEEALAKAMVPIKSFMTKRGTAAGMTMPKIELQKPAPAKPAPKVTPQVPAEGTKYVLPSFVTNGLTKGPEKGTEPINFEPETIEAAGETKPAKAETKDPAVTLADAVYQKLKAGESLGNVTEFNKLAEQHYGSSRVSGQWSPKDAFDAMEAGVNKYLLDIGKQTMARPVPEALQVLRNLMKGITSQGVRTEEQIKAQQFSTPPTESYVAAKVAGIQPSDVVLEPSAGNGGLAVWPKAIGADVHVNEISDRRQKMLEAVGFGKPSAHDGEIINSLLDPKIKPTVVLMNPPFSSGVLKGEKVKNSNQYGFNHVDSALQRLEDGGRLVAILGGGRSGFDEGASLTASGARQWFQKVAQKYNIRANVRVSGKEYQKYGTSFATRIIVIDKNGPTPGAANYSNGRVPESIVQGDADTLEQAYDLLKGVAEDRPVAGGQDDTTRREGSRSATDIERAGRAGQIEAGGGGGAGEGVSPAGVRVPAGREPATDREVQPSDRRNQPDRSAGTVQPGEAGERTPVRESGPPAQGPDEGATPASPRGGSEVPDNQRPLRSQQPEVEGLVLGHEEQSVREQEDSSAYVTYRPTLKGPTHPGSIVETKTMSTVPMPEITYRPSLPDSVIKGGKLSAVQLEAVSIAGQQNDIVLPSGHRASALIGDGTGVGKGRIGAAILWDNWNKGRKRLVWVSEKWDLMEDAKRDLNGLGAAELAKTIKGFDKWKANDPIEHEGVLFTTYALLRSEDAKGNKRSTQIQNWLRGKDEADGAYMSFDESHNLKNAVVGQMGVASEIGQTVRALLNDNPKLRTVSLSATAASDVMNLGYLDRLGLWGAGTPFPNGFGEFAANISGGGISAMEMVARELKAQGKYVSRTLSYKGVTYKEVEHKLNPDQKELYRTAVKAWRSVVQRAEDTIKNTNNGGHRAIARFMSLFYGAQLRFFNVLLTTLKIPTAIEDANQALADGKSVVITLVNTNEAAQNREKNRERVKAGDDDEQPDYDFGPAEMLVDLVREHYPTQQYADGVDDNGNKIKIPVVDADGNPVHNPEAIKQKNELMAQIKRDLKLPKNPLDILLDAFGGPSKAAELTGRKERYDENTGKFVKRGDANVKRDEVNLAEMRAFQEGKKRIAILSNAAGTGISLHADTGAKNQQKRHHITLQLGWSADKAMQMLGRTHRANQVAPPEYNTITSDLGGEKRFSAVIAKRLGNLGALSKGQKDANASADAMEKTNFDSDQGKKATQTFYRQLMRNQAIPGTEGWDVENPTRPMTGMTVLRDLAVLKKDPQTGIESVPEADQTNVTRLLNRLLALDPDIQNAVYNYYYDIFTATVNQAVEDGTLDTGVKTMHGDEFSVKEERAISTDPKTGAKTFYYPVDAQVKTNRVPPKDVEKLLKKNVGARIMQNDKGKLALVRPAADIVHADGKTSPASYVVYPHNGVQQKVENWKLHGFKEVGEGDAQAAALDKWNQAYEDAPAHETQEHHLLGGAVLRWWNQIRDAIPGTLDIYTAVDSESGKRVVGVEIPAASIRKLLGRISGGGSTVDSNQLSTDVMKNGLQYELEQGIQVRKGRVNGNPVIQLIPPSENVVQNLKRLGALYEKGITPIYYVPMRTKVDANEKVLDQILKQYPVKQDAEQPEEESILAGESGTFTPAALNPARIKQSYAKLAEKLISEKLKIGDKYWNVKQYDPDVADTLHLVDNAPRYLREKAAANLKQVTAGLSEDQTRLAALMVDSDSRDDLEKNHPAEFQQAQNDTDVMDAVNRFKPLQDELASDRQALGWPVRKSLHIEEDPSSSNPFVVQDRDGNPVADFKTEKQAENFVEQNATIEPHLKRTYPEHSKSPLPADTGAGPFTGSFYADKGLRPPKMDRKARLKSAEYHYEHGRKDFSGYLESYAQAKEAMLKQQLFDDFSNKATAWKQGTAQPPSIDYLGEKYYRPDLMLKAKQGGETLKPYAVYDPSRGERFLIRQRPDEEGQGGWSTLTTGKPGIGPNDRFLGPKPVVDALENYDASRGGEGPGKLRKFLQEQIVGLFGPMVHVNNIIRHLGQGTGTGAFDPRSWSSITKVMLSGELRDRMMKGVDDSTIDLLVRRGAYTDWRDISNLNAYIGGNFNPANWIRAFGKGVLFDPKFLGGWGGLDPKARVVLTDFIKAHAPGMSEQQIADAVSDAFGNYNRANWTERQKQIARFTLFPGWDTASAKWFLRHPFKVGIAGALVVLAANLVMHKLGLAKGDDWVDTGYLHWGDRKYRSGLVSDSIGQHAVQPILSATEAAIKGEDVAEGATQGLVRGTSALAGQLAGPSVEMVADQIFNRKYAGGVSQIVEPEDKNIPGTWAPNREIEKRIAFAALKGLPALSRFINPKGQWDWKQGLGSAMGVTNYKYGAEERLKASVAKSMGYSQTLSALAEREPEAAQKFVADPNKAVYLMFHNDLDQMDKDLKQIDKEKERVLMAGGLTQRERKEAVGSLDTARKQLLIAADALNDALTDTKLQMKKASGQ